MIPIAKPSLDEREADAARRVILSGWIIPRDPRFTAFERSLPTAWVPYTHAPFQVAQRHCIWPYSPPAFATGTKSSRSAIRISQPPTAFVTARPSLFSWMSSEYFQTSNPIWLRRLSARLREQFCVCISKYFHVRSKVSRWSQVSTRYTLA
jgi:hypothetical protein